MPDVVTIGSLFSGIEGLGLGIEAGLRDEGFDVQTLWQVEADPWCRAVLARHFPSAVRHADIRSVGAANLATVDVAHGGSPCTDLSVSGGRGGLAGDASGLWREQRRVLDELRPSVSVWENVPGARSPVRRGGIAVEPPALAVVLGDHAALGYDALWFPVRALDAGAPHLRERVFVVAWLRGPLPDARRQGLPLAEREALRGAERLGGRGAAPELPAAPHALAGPDEPAVGGGALRLPRGVDGPRGPDGAPWHPLDHRWPAPPSRPQAPWEPPRTADDRRQRRERLTALGNCAMPQPSYLAGRMAGWALRRARAAAVAP